MQLGFIERHGFTPSGALSGTTQIAETWAINLRMMLRFDTPIKLQNAGADASRAAASHCASPVEREEIPVEGRGGYYFQLTNVRFPVNAAEMRPSAPVKSFGRR
jgi:hypothetical protein